MYLYSWYSGKCGLQNVYNLLQSKGVCVIRKVAFYAYTILKVSDTI